MEMEDITGPFLETCHIYHTKPVVGLAFHPDNNGQFASCSEDKSIAIWNMNKTQRIYNFSGHSDKVSGICYNRSGKWLASCSKDGIVRFWRKKVTGESIAFRTHASPVNCLSFTSDSTKLVTGSNDKSLKIWDVKTKQFITSLVGHNNWVNSVKVSEDGSIVSTAEDKCIKIWDPITRACIHTFVDPKSIPRYVSIHRNGNSIAVAMCSGSVRIYDCRQNKLQQHYVLHDETRCVEWHPTLNYLLTAGKDGNFIFVDVMEGRPICTNNNNNTPINCVSFSPDGEHFISGGDDKAVVVWKTNLL